MRVQDKNLVPTKKGRTYIRITALSFSKMMSALMTGHGCTYKELEDACGLHQATLRRYIHGLRNEGLIYVHHGEENTRGHLTVAAWALGKKQDAPRKGNPWSAQKSKEYRARIAAAKLLGLMTRKEVEA